MQNIKLSIVGSCGRGTDFKSVCDALENESIHAVCDTNEENLKKGKEQLAATEAYSSYEEMLLAKPYFFSGKNS